MKKITAFIMTVMLLLITACSANNPAPVENTDTDADKGKLKIYFIPKNLGNPYFDAISTGFHDAVTEIGEENFSYTYTGPDTADAETQIPFIEEAIANNADAIFISPNSDNALNDILSQAMTAGVRVYCINQDIPGSEAYRDAAIMPVNFNTIGASMLELMGSQIGYAGDFAIVSATVDAPDQNTWIASLKEELKSNTKFASMNLLEVVYGNDQVEKSAEETQSLLERHASLKGIIAPTAAGIPSVCQVIKDKGLSGKVKVTGLGLPSTMAEYVLDGTCESFQLWNPPYEGYLSVYMVWAEKNDGFIPQAGAEFSAGKLGTYRLTSEKQIITLEEPMVYDKLNIEQYAILF